MDDTKRYISILFYSCVIERIAYCMSKAKYFNGKTRGDRRINGSHGATGRHSETSAKIDQWLTDSTGKFRRQIGSPPFLDTPISNERPLRYSNMAMEHTVSLSCVIFPNSKPSCRSGLPSQSCSTTAGINQMFVIDPIKSHHVFQK